MGRQCFKQDDDGHWFWVNVEEASDFEEDLRAAIESDDYDSFNTKWDGNRLSSHPSCYSFEDLHLM
jgi:hypothetical protein